MERAKEQELRTKLRAAGLSATTQRMTLLAALQAAHRPLSVEKIARIVGASLNPATIYRGLDQLTGARLARRINLAKNHALYEAAGQHHHHVVCRSCGRVEDISACLPASMPARILKSKSGFATIEDHALEFFGLCKRCA